MAKEIQEVDQVDTVLAERVTRLEDILAAYQRRAREGLEGIIRFLYGVAAGLLIALAVLML